MEKKGGEVLNRAIHLAKQPYRKLQGVRGLRGVQFEEYLVKKLGGRGGFSKGGRQFDGAVGNIWYEAKLGKFWKRAKIGSDKFSTFRSNMGSRLRIAREHGVTLELHSNSKIPDHAIKFLNKKGIKFTIHK